MKEIHEKPEAINVVFDTEAILTASTVLPEDEFPDDEEESNNPANGNGNVTI